MCTASSDFITIHHTGYSNFTAHLNSVDEIYTSSHRLCLSGYLIKKQWRKGHEQTHTLLMMSYQNPLNYDQNYGCIRNMMEATQIPLPWHMQYCDFKVCDLLNKRTLIRWTIWRTSKTNKHITGILQCAKYKINTGMQHWKDHDGTFLLVDHS